MTLGQRIAQKRKELGLSQESLGERLGVSRQAIYKWESDAALPAIEKLVDLSREFSVSIDWLLGEEDGAREDRKELTAEQLRMVEEIVGRYLAAQPRPEPKTAQGPVPDPEGESETGSAGVRWLKRWGLLWAAVAALTIITAVFFNLFAELREIKGRYGALQSAISTVSANVNSQIDGIAGRVESILEQQSSLTAEQSAEVTMTDYRAGAITIAARALPKTYVEGMTAEFILVSGGQTVTVSGSERMDHAFTAEIAGPMSDDITVSVAFLTGGQRETQQLAQFLYLYEGSLPHAYTRDSAASPQGDGWIATPQVDVFTPSQKDVYGVSAAGIDSLRLGLFQRKELVTWYREEEGRYHDGDEMHSFVLEEEIPLDLGVPYCLAIVVVDECGREMVWPTQEVVCSKKQVQDTGNTIVMDPAEWDY